VRFIVVLVTVLYLCRQSLTASVEFKLTNIVVVFLQFVTWKPTNEFLWSACNSMRVIWLMNICESLLIPRSKMIFGS